MVLLVFFLSPASGETASGEYPYLYKSPRAMGMGGAYVAIGGRTDTLFYNPAGLGHMPVDKGWEVNVLGVTGEMNENSQDFAEDMQDALDTGDVDGDGETDDDELRAVNDVLANYRGDNLHLGLSEFVSLGKKTGSVAFAIGGLATLRLDGMTHQGFGSNGLLEVNADAFYGGIGGLSYEMSNGLCIGASVKYLYREALIHTFTAREIVENQDSLDEYIEEDIMDDQRKSDSAIGFDAGIIYNIPRLILLKPAVGLSLMNIGGMDFGDAGEIPMTVNIGFAISPEIPVFHSLLIGLDYADLLHNYDQDDDIGKRLRFGGRLQLFDKKLISMAVSAGLYQGYPGFGADLRLLIFDLSYVTYAEEVGAYAGQDEDRRHIVMLNAGW
ncbi:MAG: hypothetical protein KAJ10_02540 [Thermodesulfovibrionia bacterium]|nr:hypothetical protein [Thermodesulfovibrionia bacterium]